jgi:hypothetical protein
VRVHDVARTVLVVPCHAELALAIAAGKSASVTLQSPDQEGDHVGTMKLSRDIPRVSRSLVLALMFCSTASQIVTISHWACYAR